MALWLVQAAASWKLCCRSSELYPLCSKEARELMRIRFAGRTLWHPRVGARLWRYRDEKPSNVPSAGQVDSETLEETGPVHGWRSLTSALAGWHCEATPQYKTMPSSLIGISAGTVSPARGPVAPPISRPNRDDRSPVRRVTSTEPALKPAPCPLTDTLPCLRVASWTNRTVSEPRAHRVLSAADAPAA